MSTQHTPEPWPEFDELVARDKELTEGVYVALNREQYDYARIRIQACAGIPTEKLSAIAVQLLLAEEQRDELLAALEAVMSTDQDTWDAIKMAEAAIAKAGGGRQPATIGKWPDTCENG